MDLRGAKIQDFYNITAKVGGSDNQLLPRNIKVPFYQRPYRWGEDNIEKLINDWYENLIENSDDNETKPYFAGSLVTVVDSGNGLNDEHDLIDGQQRFTTLYLANYIRFMLSRVTLRLAVETLNLLHLQSVYQSFTKSLTYLIGDNGQLFATIEQKFKQVFIDIEALGGIEDANERDEARLEVQRKAISILMLPDIIETSDEYIQKHSQMLGNLIGVNNLCLIYDRSSYNEEIHSSLTKVCIFLNEQKAPELSIYNEGTDNLPEAEIKYLDAIKTIFNSFININKKQFPNEKRAFNRAKQIIESIDSFLKEVQVCVIQTGNTNDAYTLFEVLNDRSLALDDLDLIKNQFYKKYALSNTHLTSSEIDITLQELDELWVNSIFNERAVNKKKLISYLAIVYITGDVTAQYNKGSGYRNVLDDYFENKDNYTEAQIKKHFNIFMACKNFLDTSGFMVNKRELWALQDEYNRNSSVLKRTISMLLALKQEGVLSGLMNYIFSYISTNGNESLRNFEPELFKNMLANFMGDNIEDEIKEQCNYIWKISILSPTANTPRSLAVELIDLNKLGATRPRTYRLSDEQLNEIKSKFVDYLNSWNYPSNSLKIRLLFSRLISLNLDENQNLVNPNAALSFNINEIKNLHLDHLEPKNPNSYHENNYFNDPDGQHLNGLGNMMVLPAEKNILKSNTPINGGFTYYDDAGLGTHYLTNEIKLILSQNNINNVPTESFFIERKRRIIELFKKAAEFQY